MKRKQAGLLREYLKPGTAAEQLAYHFAAFAEFYVDTGIVVFFNDAAHPAILRGGKTVAIPV